MDDIDDLRQRIDGIDDELLRLFNERARLALEIGKKKKTLGLPVHVPRREEEILIRVQRENPGPLPPTSITRLYERLIEESKRLEENNADVVARSDSSDASAS
jgi:chorismate mutase